MKIIITTLFIIIGCLSANAQFFSEEETQDKKEPLKKTIPESEQKEVYPFKFSLSSCAPTSGLNFQAGDGFLLS